MSRGLIRSALRAVDKVGTLKPGRELASFLRENNIGTERKGRFDLTRQDRKAVRAVLQQQFGVPPEATAASWDGLSRSEALDLGGNEKMTTRRVRGETVAIKPLPGAVLRLSDRDLSLPDGTALALPWTQISLSPAHDAILLIENWEVFQAIHRLTFDIPEHLQNAVCLYRGDGPGFSTEAVYDWLKDQVLKDLALPVHVFSDPDPAGLVIALTTPGFAGLMFPPPGQLREAFATGAGDRARYLAQLVKSGPYLDKCDDPEIMIYRDLINEAGRALPQEEFIRI